MAEEPQALIIDNGSYMTKAGFGGDEAPRTVFPTIVGRKQFYVKSMPNEKDAYVGDEASAKSGVLKINNPIEHGIITNWEDIEKLWHHTFYNELRVDPAEHAVILTEVANNPKINREKTTQIMFETFNIKSFYLDVQAVFSLYSCGRSKGIVFESGHQASNIVPIEDGHIISQGINIFQLAGSDLTDYGNKLLLRDYKPSMTFQPIS